MPTVNSAMHASVIKSYFDFVKNHPDAVFSIGLNMDRSTNLNTAECPGSGNPDCVFASYSGEEGAGYIEATFEAEFTPSTDYTLSRLSLVTKIPGQSWPYNRFLIDMYGFSISLTGGVPYKISLKYRVEYPTQI